MEQALRKRSLSSASARRKRIEQREQERERIRTEARQRVLALQELSDDESQPTTDDDMPASSHSRDDSVETSSEYSLETPDNTPQARYDKTPAIESRPTLHVLVPETSMDIQPDKESSPEPQLQASLTAFTDFQYDRFSIMVNSPLELLPSPASEPDEPETPCEVATPISYSLPRVRPAVVSIKSRSTSSRTPRTSSSISSLLPHAVQRAATMPPELPTRSTRRLSQVSTKSGFLASEAAPLQVPELPRNAMYMIANASRDSLAMSTHSVEASLRQHPPQTRKNSMPLLSAAFRSGHARINSIKGLVSPTFPSSTSSSTSARDRPGSSSQHTRSFQASSHNNQQPLIRPRTAVPASTPADDLSFETVPADLHYPPTLPRHHLPRPSTSHNARPSSIYSMTALPVPPPADPLPLHSNNNPLDTSVAYHRHNAGHTPHLPSSTSRAATTPSPDLSIKRKKSFSMLRKRSESISSALKFARKGGSSARDSTMPPPRSPAEPAVPSIPHQHSSISGGGAAGHAFRKSVDLMRSFPGSPLASTHSSASGGGAKVDSVGAKTPPGSMREKETRKSALGFGGGYSMFPSVGGRGSVVGLGIRT